MKTLLYSLLAATALLFASIDANAQSSERKIRREERKLERNNRRQSGPTTRKNARKNGMKQDKRSGEYPQKRENPEDNKSAQ